MTLSGQTIDEAIDLAVIRFYPDYVVAANISDLVSDLAIGTLAFLDTYGTRSSDGYAWKPMMPNETVATAIAESSELSCIVMLTRHAINSSSDKAMAILKSEFPESLKTYYECCHLLLDFLSAEPGATS